MVCKKHRIYDVERFTMKKKSNVRKSYIFDDDVLVLIEVMAKKLGISRTGVIERGVRRAYIEEMSEYYTGLFSDVKTRQIP